MIPKLGLCPKTPHIAEGTRIDPPMSVPISKLVMPVATAAAAGFTIMAVAGAGVAPKLR